MSLINEEINRIKNIMGLITESVSLPITLTGSYPFDTSLIGPE